MNKKKPTNQPSLTEKEIKALRKVVLHWIIKNRTKIKTAKLSKEYLILAKAIDKIDPPIV